MDERLRICLWMVGGGGLGVGLGAAFGALTAVMYSRSGGTAGTRLARGIVAKFQDTPEENSSSDRTALIGAVDGSLFLGTLGLVAGVLLGASGRGTQELIVPAAVGSTVLVSGAAFFGGLAYSLVRNGLRAVFWVFAGGLAGTLLAGFWLGADHCLLGTIPGLLLGLILSFFHRNYAPAFRTPHVEVVAPQARAESETDITRSPHRRSADDIRKK